jgi:hypothetical protein
MHKTLKRLTLKLIKKLLTRRNGMHACRRRSFGKSVGEEILELLFFLISVFLCDLCVSAANKLIRIESEYDTYTS